MCKEYNGWTNYETWAVALWLDNDQKYMQELAQSTYDNAEPERYFTRLERAQIDLEDAIKEYVTDSNPLADTNSMYADLLNAAISIVNWSEISKNYLENVDTSESSEETESVE